MLMLNVKDSDYIMIGEDIKVSFFLNSEKTRVSRIGIDAPKSVPILRKAVYERNNNICVERSLKTLVVSG